MDWEGGGICVCHIKNRYNSNPSVIEKVVIEQLKNCEILALKAKNYEIFQDWKNHSFFLMIAYELVYLGYTHNKSQHRVRITCLSSREGGNGEKRIV